MPFALLSLSLCRVQLFVFHAPPHSEKTYLQALPYLRFLHYRTPGSSMAPHVDLRKRAPGDASKRTSTRTFLLYLETCGSGGETLLLQVG